MDVKKAGYGVASGCGSPSAGVAGAEGGMARLCVLTAGVVFRDELRVEGALSRLRERLDDHGDIGIPACAMSGSVLVSTPFNLALRLRARSLCSVTRL